MLHDVETETHAAQEAPACYRSSHEHLTDLLVRHDWYLKRLLARRRGRKPDDVLGFAAISEHEVRRLLEVSGTEAAGDARLIERTLQELERDIGAKVEHSLAQGIELPIVELQRRFALSSREVDFLITCLAVELDARYERVYGYLHDDMSRRLASPGIALSLYCDHAHERLDARAMLSPQAALRHYRLIEMTEEGGAIPWMSRALRVDERIATFIVGDDSVDPRIARYLRPATADSALGARAEAVEKLVQSVQAARAHGRPLIYMCGARATADGLVQGAAERLGLPLLTLSMDELLESPPDLDELLFRLAREGLLSQAALYLRHLDRALEPPNAESRCRSFMRCIADMGGVVFASGEQSWNWPLPPASIALKIVELQPDGFAEQVQAWQAVSNGAFGEAELHRLVSLQPLPVAVIPDVWRMAHVIGTSDENDAAASPSLDHVRQACRAHAGRPASTLARSVDPKHKWEDLVLPGPQLEQLSALCSHAKHSSIVYGSWGFERKLALGRGLNALFCGPPGTGKSMGAEVIASDLGLGILKIDLSQIVSKYIGETEKNLRQLFDQAGRANAILFFDEADALLGKRSEVKDAHDRYANTETAYLLQKMEEYTGISILATNFRQNIDEAFVRRMRFIIDFPFPEEDDRLKIWQSVWPSEVPIAADVDLPTLARQFRLTGGSIRNVALSAAFLAAEQERPVSMRHLMRATKRELQKMGRLVNEEDHRKYG